MAFSSVEVADCLRVGAATPPQVPGMNLPDAPALSWHDAGTHRLDAKGGLG